MSDYYLGQIKLFAGSFAPRGFAFCDGQILAIRTNTALFSLLGTSYGGDGSTTFGLPDLRGRVPMHRGNGAGLTPRSIGEEAGEETVTLLASNLPNHTHAFHASTATGTLSGPVGTAVPATPRLAATSTGKATLYAVPSTGGGNLTIKPMAATSLPAGGSNTPEPNMMPYQAINFIIALQGIFPSRN